jgi:hypothetical protein
MSRAQVWVGVGLAAAGIALVVVGILRQADRTTGEPPPGVPGLEDRRREGEDLDARVAASLNRLLEKHAATSALIRGEIGLREAVNRFRTLVATRPAALDDLRRAYPAATDTELLYRHVIEFVRARLGDEPDLAPGLVTRLEAELARTFPRGLKSPPGTGGVLAGLMPTARAE